MPGVCKAREGRCPLGSEDEHHSTPEAAAKAFEHLMRQEVLQTNLSKRGMTQLRKSKRDEFQAKLRELRGSRSPRSRNWGQLQEFNLGIRSILNDLDDLDVAEVHMGGRRFTRTDGEIYADGERVVIDQAHLDELAEGLKQRDQSKVHDALSSISLSLGFEGDVPVAGSNEKIDLRIVSADGVEFSTSVKAFTGSSPSLQDPAKSSYAGFRTKLTDEQLAIASAVLASTSMTDAQKAKALFQAGVRFDKHNFALHATFREHLSDAAGTDAPEAYEETLHTRLVGRETVTNPSARNRILGAYATSMTNTGRQAKPENVANAMLELHRNGEVKLFISDNPEAIGEHLSERIRVDSASAHPNQWVLVGNELRVKVFSSFRIKPC